MRSRVQTIELVVDVAEQLRQSALEALCLQLE